MTKVFNSVVLKTLKLQFCPNRNNCVSLCRWR